MLLLAPVFVAFGLSNGHLDLGAWLGQTSYAFSLVHLMARREVEQHVGPAAARLVVALVASVFLAWVLHALLDRPSHALRRRALARVSVMAG